MFRLGLVLSRARRGRPYLNAYDASPGVEALRVPATKKRIALKERQTKSERRAIRSHVAFENDDSGELAYFLPLLQSGQRLKFYTQGSAKPPPWAEFRNRFAVNPTGCRASLQTNLNRGFRLRRTFLLW
jgi:hypothetical protein